MKSQGWTALILDTNGNGKRDAYVEPEPAGRSGEGQAVRRRFLCGGAGARRVGLGIGARFPGRDRAPESRIESARNGARGNLRAAVGRSESGGAGFLAARHGHRPQRRGVGGARERTHGQLRSAQVQGPAQRAERDGQHCPEGWTLYPEPLPQIQGRDRLRAAPKRATTRGSISSTRSDSARTCRSTPATRPKGCWC